MQLRRLRPHPGAGQARGPRRHRPARGQTLVEFALVLPLFLLIVFAVIEFAIAYSAMIGISYATRDAALLAAEAGNQAGADCVILQAVEKAVSAPADRTRIGSVVIYRANQNGVEMAGVSNSWTRGGSTSCPDGSTVPYTRQTNGYPEADRCNYLSGCGAGHPGLDTIGVRVSYSHSWVTPLGTFGGWGFGGQGGTGFVLSQSNSMRMEPIL